jgi:hypothetical protein
MGVEKAKHITFVGAKKKGSDARQPFKGRYAAGGKLRRGLFRLEQFLSIAGLLTAGLLTFGFAAIVAGFTAAFAAIFFGEAITIASFSRSALRVRSNSARQLII